MTDLDKGHAGTGGEPQTEAGPLPFFPGPPGLSGPLPPAAPLSAPPPASPAPAPPSTPSHDTSTHSASSYATSPYLTSPHTTSPHTASLHGPPAAPSAHTPVSPAMPLHGGGPHAEGPGPEAPSDGEGGAPTDGRITIEDEVIEKIAALAALEVHGVVGLAGPPGADERRGAGGVRVRLHGDEVTLDLGIAVGYGSVIMEVARVVQANVGRVAGLMLGMRVAAVNVAVEDVRVTAEAAPPPGTSAYQPPAQTAARA
ncbi:Asp23/Gls24 family envelope stress response protein [Actinomadura macra]|uniref:Asp23/Gls24 family envelope stress response protein n=1 Tax=Actinomadura macra TaxID=46164 RepID=UPI00082D90E3|nr:Asp23/Gls24 family envelope stress response protein [Actinomadura macra]